MCWGPRMPELCKVLRAQTPAQDWGYIRCLRAPVAQWIEHLTSDQGVGGSNPSGRATFLNLDVTHPHRNLAPIWAV